MDGGSLATVGSLIQLHTGDKDRHLHLDHVEKNFKTWHTTYGEKANTCSMMQEYCDSDEAIGCTLGLAFKCIQTLLARHHPRRTNITLCRSHVFSWNLERSWLPKSCPVNTPRSVLMDEWRLGNEWFRIATSASR